MPDVKQIVAKSCVQLLQRRLPTPRGAQPFMFEGRPKFSITTLRSICKWPIEGRKFLYRPPEPSPQWAGYPGVPKLIRYVGYLVVHDS